tara:strand:+ start:4499 stop:8350 length:3852 start_codon:yes stop_codon:yes gene_type:complete
MPKESKPKQTAKPYSKKPTGVSILNPPPKSKAASASTQKKKVGKSNGTVYNGIGNVNNKSMIAKNRNKILVLNPKNQGDQDFLFKFNEIYDQIRKAYSHVDLDINMLFPALTVNNSGTTKKMSRCMNKFWGYFDNCLMHLNDNDDRHLKSFDEEFKKILKTYDLKSPGRRDKIVSGDVNPINHQDTNSESKVNVTEKPSQQFTFTKVSKKGKVQVASGFQGNGEIGTIAIESLTYPSFVNAYQPQKYMIHMQALHVRSNLQFFRGAVESDYDLLFETRKTISNIGNGNPNLNISNDSSQANATNKYRKIYLVDRSESHRLQYELMMVFGAFQLFVMNISQHYIDAGKYNKGGFDQLKQRGVLFNKFTDRVFNVKSSSGIYNNMFILNNMITRSNEVIRSGEKSINTLLVESVSKAVTASGAGNAVKNYGRSTMINNNTNLPNQNTNSLKRGTSGNLTNMYCNHCYLKLPLENYETDVGHEVAFMKVFHITFFYAEKWINHVFKELGLNTNNPIDKLLHSHFLCLALMIMPKICETLINKYLEHGHCNRAHDEYTVSRVIELNSYLHERYIPNSIQIQSGYLRLMSEDRDTMLTQRMNVYKQFMNAEYGIIYGCSVNSRRLPIICNVCMRPAKRTGDPFNQNKKVSTDAPRYIECNKYKTNENSANKNPFSWSSHQSSLNTFWICNQCNTYKEFTKKVTINKKLSDEAQNNPGRLNFNQNVKKESGDKYGTYHVKFDVFLEALLLSNNTNLQNKLGNVKNVHKNYTEGSCPATTPKTPYTQPKIIENVNVPVKKTILAQFTMLMNIFNLLLLKKESGNNAQEKSLLNDIYITLQVIRYFTKLRSSLEHSSGKVNNVNIRAMIYDTIIALLKTAQNEPFNFYKGVNLEYTGTPVWVNTFANKNWSTNERSKEEYKRKMWNFASTVAGGNQGVATDIYKQINNLYQIIFVRHRAVAPILAINQQRQEKTAKQIQAQQQRVKNPFWINVGNNTLGPLPNISKTSKKSKKSKPNGTSHGSGPSPRGSGSRSRSERRNNNGTGYNPAANSNNEEPNGTEQIFSHVIHILQNSITKRNEFLKLVNSGKSYKKAKGVYDQQMNIAENSLKKYNISSLPGINNSKKEQYNNLKNRNLQLKYAITRKLLAKNQQSTLQVQSTAGTPPIGRQSIRRNGSPQKQQGSGNHSRSRSRSRSVSRSVPQTPRRSVSFQTNQVGVPLRSNSGRVQQQGTKRSRPNNNKQLESRQRRQNKANNERAKLFFERAKLQKQQQENSMRAAGLVRSFRSRTNGS